MKRMRLLSRCLLIFSCLIPARPCFAQPYSRAFFTMGTMIEITVFHEDGEKADEAIEAAEQEVKKVDECASVYDKKSEAVKFNMQSPGKAFTASALFFSLMRQSLHYYHMTGGAFDATVFPLVKLWGFYDGHPPVKFPSKKIIQAVLKNTGGHAVSLDEAHSRITKQKNVQMDFGGIAKGYALDMAAQALKEHGMQNARLDFASTTFYMGKPSPEPFYVNVVPRPGQKDKALMVLKIDGGAMSVSGNTENYFVYNGKKYAHIINPETGMPVTGALAMVIVTCKTAVCADALSTALFVMGVKKGKAFLKKHPQVSAIFVEEKQKKFFVYAHKKLKPVLALNQQGNKNAVISFF